MIGGGGLIATAMCMQMSKVGGAEPSDDWQPPGDWPYIPEPGDYEVCMLVEVVAPASGDVDIGFDLGIAALFKRSSDTDWYVTSGIGPLTIDWGDGTVLSAMGYDPEVWDNGNGSSEGTGWSIYMDGNYAGSVNEHKYNAAGKYVIRITSNQYSNFLNLLRKEGQLGNIYTLAIKCGMGILVAQPNESSGLEEDWFKKFNSRLQYIKYAGEGANFPSGGFGYNANSLKKIETVNPYREIGRGQRTGDIMCINQCHNLSKFDFSECEKITNVSFNASGLKKVDLPKCTEINNKYGCFTGCVALAEINAPLLKNIPTNFSANCGALKKVNIPLCEKVSEYAFSMCGLLSGIELPNCIAVEKRAFYNCTHISKMYLPECTAIGDEAFMSCATLEEIYAPKCASVGNYAFSYCTALQKVTFADGCTFGNSTFDGCPSLYPIPT